MSEPTAPSTQLNCEQCRELLSGYVDRELTAEEQQGVERHLASCSHCASESTRMVGLKQVVQHWDGVEGSTEFHEVVLQKMITESQMMPSRQFTEAADRARAESVRLQDASPPRGNWIWLVIGLVVASAVLALLAFIV